ncbi:galactose-1-epimerase [Maribellus comscasis]|uniref:Aldose 1-epimerase n=1 Tax=Maribellus comscasis TaxID=2681766 RepID=A0A6I6JZC4_9BACT|nr:aldose epimerase family protein [Maribellus comscasis]QGY46500.1 galactose-1-epimerase [Maribellus comscasis]
MKLFTIENKNGIKTTITSYGGRVVSLFVPDRNGNLEDVVLGYDNLADYLSSNEKYYGATIGRYGNRIGNARFSIGEKEYTLEKNNCDNSLHGGSGGFHNVIWDVKQLDKQTLKLKYLSKDMEEGFPGNLDVKVIYSLTDNNELKIEYFAETNQATIVNFTHHSFFNLTGNLEKSINNHILQINAESYTPVDGGLIPTGEISPVEGTPFDFREPVSIGKRVDEEYEQLILGKGYDHNWVLDASGLNKDIRLAAKVVEPESGRTMEVFTNEPGIQFYGGNFLNGSDVGKNGIAYRHRTAFCLETQHFPDSPNIKQFPSTMLFPGEEYYSVCIYRFDVIN